jgi:hypothetical protein
LHGAVVVQVLLHARGAEGHQDVLPLADAATEERARSFVGDPALKAEMEQAGVQRQPAVTLCDEVEAVSY